MEPIPPPLARVADLLSEFPASWAFCGGWAVDAWLGRTTRPHEDVDLTIFHEDQLVLFDFLTIGWLLNAHDDQEEDTKAPWSGREVGFPAHIHAYGDGFNLDIQLNRRANDEWVFSAKRRITLPLRRCLTTSPWGIPTLSRDAILFYKAIGFIRPHDEADFRALVPELTDEERRWLVDALMTLRPNHPWLVQLG